MLNHTEQQVVREMAIQLELALATVRRRHTRKRLVRDPVQNVLYYQSEMLSPAEFNTKQQGVHLYNCLLSLLVCPHVQGRLPEICTIERFLSEVGTMVRWLRLDGLLGWRGSGHPALPPEPMEPRRPRLKKEAPPTLKLVKPPKTGSD